MSALNPFWMALVGAICWGMAPLFGKVGLRGVNPMVGLVARTMITAVFVLGLACRNGCGSSLMQIPGKRWFYLAIEAFLATFAGDLAYYAAIKYGAIGKTSLVLAVSPLITLAVGWLFLNEVLSSLQIIGAALVIMGLVLVNF